MPAVPTPLAFVGKFCVLSWDSDREHYTLYVDDGASSSYKLRDVASVQAVFTAWGMAEFGARVVEQAREFKQVQAIPSQDRVINLIDRNRRPTLVWATSEGPYASLPDL